MDAASLAGRMQGWTPFDSSPPPQPESDASSPTMNMPRTDRMSPVKLMGGSPGRDAKMPIGPPVMHKPDPYHAQGVSTSPNGQGAGNGMQTIGRMGQQRQGLPGPPLPSGMFGLESGIGGPPLVNPGPGQFGQSLSPFDGQLGRGPSPPNGLQRGSSTPQPLGVDDGSSAGGLPGAPPQLMNPRAMGTGGMGPGGMGPGGMGIGMFPQQMDFAQQMMQQAQAKGLNWTQHQQQMQPDMPPKGFKTVICKFWENNMCAKGASCTFAHGQDDLQRYPGAGSGVPGMHPPSPLKLDRYKTKLCLFFAEGRCCKGPHCPYAHGYEELRSAPPGSLPMNQEDVAALFGAGGGFGTLDAFADMTISDMGRSAGGLPGAPVPGALDVDLDSQHAAMALRYMQARDGGRGMAPRAAMNTLQQQARAMASPMGQRGVGNGQMPPMPQGMARGQSGIPGALPGVMGMMQKPGSPVGMQQMGIMGGDSMSKGMNWSSEESGALNSMNVGIPAYHAAPQSGGLWPNGPQWSSEAS